MFESSGNIGAASSTPKLVARGGTIIQVGVLDRQTPYDFKTIMLKKAVIKSAYKYCNDFKPAIRLAGSGQLPARQIITQCFDFSRLKEAMELADRSSDNLLKDIVVI